MKKIVPDGAQLIPKNAKCVFKGEIFDVYQWPQKMFDGSTATFEMLRRPDYTSVIAITDDKVVILKQLQPDWKKYKYTLPGGRTDNNENPLDAAKRELKEESGMTYATWKLVNVRQPSGRLEAFEYTYVATNLLQTENIHLDPGEKIQVELMNFSAANKLALSEVRLMETPLRYCKSLQQILNLPEFIGEEIEV